MEKGNRWWNSSIGYIIYPQAFRDSNGDGIGDIRGIIEKLDYLASLGVNLLWICPLFASPMDDNGYDVSDYYKINPSYGTEEDFQNLLKEAHERGIRVLVDFVLNHTSDEHPWFQKALKDPSSKERGYYFFRKGRKENGKLLPPNNWKGFFSTSAWKQVEGSEDFYLHIFSEKMPDVNWENPELRERYFEIARYYLDLGVDGFRLDAVAHLAKDTSFSDSTLPVDATGLVLDTSKFSNRPAMFDYLRMLKDEAFSRYDCLTVGEAGGCISPQEALKLVDRENGSITMAFNFDTCWNNGAFCSVDKEDAEIVTDVRLLKHNFLRWYEGCHERADMPLYWENHDHPRVLSQYGDIAYRKESGKALLSISLFLYGTPFLYFGEEIGMSNVCYEKPEDFFSDVNAKNDVISLRAQGKSEATILRYLNRCSRVNARTPMQWDSSSFAGFSSKGSINKVNSNYLEGVNVETEERDPDSILNYAKKAIALRKKENALVQEGSFAFLDCEHPDVIAFRHQKEGETLDVIVSLRAYPTQFAYEEAGEVLLHNYPDESKGEGVLFLRPFEAYIIKR